MGLPGLSRAVLWQCCHSALLEHPPIQPGVKTKVVAPFVVRAYAKVPLLGGHHRYYSRTYLAFFGSLHERGATDVYML